MYQLAADGVLNISTGDNDISPQFDTTLGVYMDVGGVCTSLGCDDDGGAGTRDSFISLPTATAGTYYVAVTAYSSSDGCFNLCAQVPSGGCPATDCSRVLNYCGDFDPETLDTLEEGETACVETVAATADSLFPGSVEGEEESLFYVAIPEDADATMLNLWFAQSIGTDDRLSESDPTITLYTGGCDELGYSDDAFGSRTGGLIQVTAMPGWDFIVQAGTFGSGSGITNYVGTCWTMNAADAVTPTETPCGPCHHQYECEDDDGCLGWGSCTDEGVCGASSLFVGLALLSLQ
jgi:hypothetical protein